MDPGRVLIIANRKNTHSMELARFYADQRDIPSHNLLLLDLPNKEYISRGIYKTNLARPIRQFLLQQKLEGTIKVLVTIYGMPLKVGPSKPTLVQRRQAEKLKQKYFQVFRELEESTASAHSLTYKLIQQQVLQQT